ncbi:RidA family protein [Gammaproteobacteria bacterium]|jgi:2-iminobutanoate/2-iminopropanoate deaminase|nr:RidA family protein [Gammaproteobacteria bacterium]MDA7747571.1 RidA family protein [Gammaproteobacteria bacterium]MDA7829821.1 RidA family protein [Gammaproteobacteria bacterium]MDA7844404.1 RidA family protein [Gammaproteobacteria bacterium]MDA9102759.1 RidA family protein [Gammaproteobacteria bacterium]|tara:strand:+ start:381 stop:767 length:387 start_codon:yes stop_codon:yes gene_type:complete
MTKEIIFTQKAPKAIGPYSQAVKAGGFLFVSGQIPINPETGDLMIASIEEQANQVILNLKSICEAAGSGLEDIVKLTIYLTDLGNFAKVNEAMLEYFLEPYPARATVEISALPLGVNVEMDAIVISHE